MLSRKERAYISENSAKLSIAQIAKDLNIPLPQLQQEMKRLKIKPESCPTTLSPSFACKNASIRSKNRKWIALAVLIIFFATFFVYSNTLKSDFIWDDEYLILNNSQIKSFSHFFSTFRTYVGYGSENINNFYRPIQEISDMVDYFLWGKDPFGFHLTNILLHASVAVLVFLAVFYLCGSVAVAAVAGLLFGVHPIHTEAVSYIAGRADSLYTLFFLGSLILFIRYTNRRLNKVDHPKLYVCSLALFALSLMSKEISMILPVVILLYALFYIKGATSPSIYRSVKFLVIPYAAISGIYIFLRMTVLNFSHIAPSNILGNIPLFNRVLTFLKVIVIYIKLLFFPTGLHMERVVGICRSLLDPVVVFAFILLAVIAVFAVRAYSKNRVITFFILWFFINIFPTSNIIPINSFLAEHWLYVASIAYFYLLALFLVGIFSRSKNRAVKTVIAIVGVIIVFKYGAMTMQQNKVWKDEVAFFENTLKYNPKNARLYLNFGNTYAEKGNTEKALEQYRKAISIRKDFAEAYGNIGSILIGRGNLDDAEKNFKKALEIKYNYPIAHFDLGLIYYYQQRFQDALSELQIALSQLPNHYQSMNMMAEIYLRNRERDKALAMFKRSLAVAPNQDNVQKAITRLLAESK